jgi:hypothetical protein
MEPADESHELDCHWDNGRDPIDRDGIRPAERGTGPG